jgi:hypothetical protein
MQQLTNKIVDSVLEEFRVFATKQNIDLGFLIKDFKKSSIQSEIKEDNLLTNQKCSYVYKKGNHINEQCSITVKNGKYCAKHKKLEELESTQPQLILPKISNVDDIKVGVLHISEEETTDIDSVIDEYEDVDEDVEDSDISDND